MMKFRQRQASNDEPPPPNTVVGIGSNVRGTMMVSGTLRIEGEFEGDILNCDRLEIGEHGVMRSDIEVKSAVIYGRIYGNIRALGTLEMKSGARIEGDVTAMSVIMEPGVFFTGRCTMLENGPDSITVQTETSRIREFVKS